ncbi:MAG: DUF6171 family protein [Bacillota bacterium]
MIYAPPCKRCLLTDMQEEQAFYDIIKERIRLLPDGERADPAEYRRRLAICGQCDRLSRGTCAQCGCYVEIRAARQAMRCADPVQKW